MLKKVSLEEDDLTTLETVTNKGAIIETDHGTAYKLNLVISFIHYSVNYSK